MIHLDAALLDTSRGEFSKSSDLSSCLNARGLYNSLQFVLRLSPEVHRRLAEGTGGIVHGANFELTEAFSVYLHETLHWWQHVGTTTGLMLSLSHPAQSHANYSHLKKFLSLVGPKKSIRRLVETMESSAPDPDTAGGLSNIIVNNHYDIEFFRALITNPHLAPELVEHPLFESVGHAFEIAYGNILLVLARTVDEQFICVPDPRSWEGKFSNLRTAKVRGFFWRSDVVIPPLGAYEIFEGQARFVQLQYLYFASGERLAWDDANALGLLSGVYITAFDLFLRLSEIEWPASIGHPVVALFLVICDVACNSTTAFPLPLEDVERFVSDIDPGIRFVKLCQAAREFRKDLMDAVQAYSREEYVHVSEKLAHAAGVKPPLALSQAVADWRRQSAGIEQLMARYEGFNYSDENLPVQVLLSHYIAFQEDKLQTPEVFCWTGAWFAGERVSSTVEGLFYKHQALFTDKADDDSIFPVLRPGLLEPAIDKMFQRFYQSAIVYDLVRQWVMRPGPFIFDYQWLSQSGSTHNIKKWSARNFENVFGINPDRFEILSDRAA